MESTRAEPGFFDQFLEAVARDAKPYSIVLADTTACLIPQAAAYMVRRIKEVTGAVAEVHSHSDFGLGVATSIAAVAAGAEVVHASIAGIGERTGNTPLEEVAVALRTLLNVELGIDFSKLTEIGRKVAEIAKIQLPLSKPVIGENTFTRESGMGLNLIQEMPLALFALNPAFVGQEPRYVLGKKSGLASVEMKIKDLRLEPLSAEGMKKALDEVKKIGIQKKGLLSDEEFKSVVSKLRA